MEEKKERTPAQRAADKKYAEKSKGKHKVISFIYSAEEAIEIEKAIAATGLSKADFLRQVVKDI